MRGDLGGDNSSRYHLRTYMRGGVYRGTTNVPDYHIYTELYVSNMEGRNKTNIGSPLANNVIAQG